MEGIESSGNNSVAAHTIIGSNIYIWADAGSSAESGRATNIIGMTGQDLYFILSGEISLTDAISQKVRRAAETGEFYAPIFDLLRS